MELAVNMPAQEPQVGQAMSSIASRCSAGRFGLLPPTSTSTASMIFSWPATTALPASIGPPETKIVGMLRRMAAISMPGVILSQLEMQTSASAQCAFTMYSTASAISSRLGRL